MIKLYDIVNYKTNIRGYWLDKNKVYKDNIRISNIKTNIRFKTEKHFLFDYKKQLAVFYIKFDRAYIENKEGDITILKNLIEYRLNKLSKDKIKELLYKYNGLTIIKEKNCYVIQIWQ